MIGAALAIWLLAVAAETAPPGAPAREASEGPCGLLTAQEIGVVAGGKVVERKSAARVAGDLAIADCFFRSEPFESSVSLELTRGASGAARSVAEHWEAIFDEPQEKDGGEARGGEREGEAAPLAIEGVGDEAFWIGNPASGALYVLNRKGDAFLRVSVGGGGGEELQRRKAIALARKALDRI
jgi:hypothetical protein